MCVGSLRTSGRNPAIEMTVVDGQANTLTHLSAQANVRIYAYNKMYGWGGRLVLLMLLVTRRYERAGHPPKSCSPGRDGWSIIALSGPIFGDCQSWLAPDA